MTPSRPALYTLLALVIAGPAAACSKESSASAKAPARSSARVKDSSGGTVDLGGEPYHAGAIASVGSVSGRITGDVASGVDSSSAATTDPACAKAASTRPARTGNGLADAVVWIADATSGKALPIEKRFELGSEDCDLEPRVQAAVTGSTFNVFNDDRLLHRLVFLRIGTHDTLTVMPFFNAGQIVASERLATSPGVVEVRCVQHPWTHAYIAVFDHPYFAVTKPDGSFTIDSLPPGSYRVMVWHPGLAKPVQQQVQITAGGQAKLDVAVTR